MKADIKALWTGALRSGEYKQGMGYLKYNSNSDGKARHCCLGVLCELAVKAGVMPEGDKNGFSFRFGKGNDTNTAILPYSVREWAGLPDGPGTYNDGDKSLSGDNDSGVLFPEIADIIDANF